MKEINKLVHLFEDIDMFITFMSDATMTISSTMQIIEYTLQLICSVSVKYSEGALIRMVENETFVQSMFRIAETAAFYSVT